MAEVESPRENLVSKAMYGLNSKAILIKTLYAGFKVV